MVPYKPVKLLRLPDIPPLMVATRGIFYHNWFPPISALFLFLRGTLHLNRHSHNNLFPHSRIPDWTLAIIFAKVRLCQRFNDFICPLP